MVGLNVLVSDQGSSIRGLKRAYLRQWVVFGSSFVRENSSHRGQLTSALRRLEWTSKQKAKLSVNSVQNWSYSRCSCVRIILFVLKKAFSCISVLAKLLIRAGVEVNPGPGSRNTFPFSIKSQNCRGLTDTKKSFATH